MKYSGVNYSQYHYFLNLGGIPKHLAYLSRYIANKITSFDLCWLVSFLDSRHLCCLLEWVSPLLTSVFFLIYVDSIIVIRPITLYLSHSQMVDFGFTPDWLNFFSGLVLFSRKISLYVYNPMHTGVRFAALIFDLYSFLTCIFLASQD